MSKCPHDSQAPAHEDLDKRLKSAGDEAELVREIVEHSGASIVSTLEAPNRQCSSLPEERKVLLSEVALFADRDTLDTMQLVCGFLKSYIRKRELTHLALRPVSSVVIGRYFDYEAPDVDDYRGWLPTIEVEYDRDTGKEPAPNTAHQLSSCLRTAFCKEIRIHIDTIADTDSAFEQVCGMVFDGLDAQSTFVGTLYIALPLCKVELALRGITAFKSVRKVIVESREIYADAKFMDESFFVPAAERGVRHVEFLDVGGVGEPEISADTAAALAFGFADPRTGDDRSLFGIDCDIGEDFLPLVKQKASELGEVLDIDFIFKITTGAPPLIDSTGFEKYQRDDGRSWLLNDLENHLNVEVAHIEDRDDVQEDYHLVEIRVFSPGRIRPPVVVPEYRVVMVKMS